MYAFLLDRIIITEPLLDRSPCMRVCAVIGFDQKISINSGRADDIKFEGGEMLVLPFFVDIVKSICACALCDKC